MQVRATRHGFYGATFHAPGDVFEVSDGLRGSWFVPLDPAQEPADAGDIDPGKSRRGRSAGGLRKQSEPPAPPPADPGSL